VEELHEKHTTYVNSLISTYVLLKGGLVEGNGRAKRVGL
jgi:hypothetical protein